MFLVISYFGSIIYVNAELIDLEKHHIICDNNINQSPIFGPPSPLNGSISSSSNLKFSWRINISDPDGDAFSWSIECSNRQMNAGIDASNGTKSLYLSGLEYSKTYMVWVNASDPGGSGLYTRKWYRFTTFSPTSIESITGGIGVNSKIYNNCDINVTFNWGIKTDGLVLLNGNVSGEETLGPWESITIKTGLMLGFGNINITVTVDTETVYADARLLFFMVTYVH